MKLLSQLSNDWNCQNCGNDKLDGAVRFNEKWQANQVVYTCSECNEEVAYRFL